MLLGELFTNLKLFPFMRRGILEQNTDFNNIQNQVYTHIHLWHHLLIHRIMIMEFY